MKKTQKKSARLGKKGAKMDKGPGNRTLLRFYSDLTSAKCHEPVQLSPQFPLIRQVLKEAEMLKEFLADPSKFAAVIRTWANETPKASSLVRCG